MEEQQNKILQHHVENALDRGKLFKDRLDKEGAEGKDVNAIMDTLENKMALVEDLLEKDKSRQIDSLALRLRHRKGRRANLQEELDVVNQKLDEKEQEAVVEKDRAMTDLQEKLTGEMAAVDDEEKERQDTIDRRFQLEKQERLSEYQDRLENARGGKDFRKILAEFQEA